MRKDPRHIIVWAVQKPDITYPKMSRVSYANPRLWDKKIRPIYDAVYAPDYPHIEAEFERVGVKAWRPEGGVSNKELQNSVADTVVQESKESSEDIDALSKEWRNLPWPQMRSKATAFTDEPIKSKEQAKEILEKAESEGKI